MNNYFLLTKVYILSSFSVNKKKQSQKPVIQKLILLGLLFFVFSIIYNLMQFFQFKMNGDDYRGILVFVLTITSFLTVIMTFNQMQNNLYNGKDYDLISSLPIKKTTVIASKITSILAICLIEDLIIFLPTIILYLIYTGDVLVSIFSFVAVLFISFIPLLISTILGTIVAIVTKKVKNKNIFQIIIYLAYFVVVFLISFSMQNSRVIDPFALTNALPYLKLFTYAIYYENILYLLLFILANIVSFVVVVFLIGHFYEKINAAQNYAGNGKYVLKEEKNIGLKKALFKKELKMLTGNANYLVNSILGSIIFVISVIMLFVLNFAPDATEEQKESVNHIFFILIPFMGILMNSIFNSTVASISLEGKNFEMLLCYPIKTFDILKAKIKVGFFVPLVCNLIASTIITIFLLIRGIIIIQYDWLVVLEIYIMPNIALLYSSVLGILCNLKWPKIDFETEIQVIKQSQSTIYFMLLSFLPAFVIGGISIVLGFISTIISSIFLILVYSIAIIIVYSILKKKGEELFKSVITK